MKKHIPSTNRAKSKRKKMGSDTKRGLPPGSLVFVGDQKIDFSSMSLFQYDGERLQEHNNFDKTNIQKQMNDSYRVNWLNVHGLHDTELIGEIGTIFNVDRLILEDLLNTNQRPKLDARANYSFCVFKIYHYSEESCIFEEEQISILFGENFVISFQEKPGDIFDSVRERIRSSSGNVRTRGADYLSYALMDMLIDNYFFVFEKISDRIENIEDEIIENPDEGILPKLHAIRKEVAELRKSIYPLREVVSKLEKDENNLLKEDTRIYVKDLHDHIIQVIDNVENFRDATKSLLELYMSGVSNKMNSVMKVLTVISTIFIPLTFVVGVYGMNFKYMPELDTPYGYFITWGVMVLIAMFMWYILKRQKWL